jgi:diguanylate cyclase (GGDEF)-like protein/PAS domain S-box-containing protein
MSSLEHLTRDALAARVRDLEARLAAAQAPAPDLDYVAQQALTVLENSGIPALIYDTEGTLRILAANACMAAQSGHSATELVALNLPRLLAGEDARRHARLLRLPRQGGFSSAGGWRSVTRNGEIREVEVSGYDLAYRGRRARFVIVQDVTRRKRDQLTQQRLATIVETSQDAILSQTLEGVVLSWNKAAERLFGWSPVDMIGRDDSALFPDDIREQEVAFIRARMLADQPIEYRESVRLHRSGARIGVAVSVSPLKDEEGRVIGASSILRDMRPARASERLLTAIVGSTDEAILSWSPDGSVLTWNPGAHAMLGYGAVEMLGRPVEVVLPDALAGAPNLLARVRAGEHVRGAETVAHHRNGTAIQVSATCSPIRDEHQRLSAVACILRDIRAQKLRERLLSEGHQRLKLALESAELSLWDWDVPAGRVDYSEGFSRVLGFTPADMPRASSLFEQLVHPDDRPDLEGRLNSHLHGDSGFWRAEFRARTSSGGYRWMGARGRVVGRDREGKALRMIGVVQDIEPRKREQTQRLLAPVVESSQDAIISYDLEGNILSWNRGAQAMFGYRPDEVLGRNFRLFAPASAVESTRELRERAVAGLPVPPFEVMVRHKEGHGVVASVTVSVLRGEDGMVTSVVTMARDITTQKRTELLMARTQALGRVGGWQVECSTGRLYWTEETFRIHDLSPDLYRPELENALSFYAPEAQTTIRGALTRAMREGVAFDLELPLTTAHGRRIWVRCIGEALAQDGRIAQVYGSLQDITTRRQTEDALRESERQLQTILNDAAEGILVVGTEGDVERINLEARRMFGYQAHEAHRLSLRDLVPELEFAADAESSAQPIRHLLGSRREVTGRRKDGSLFPLELSLSEISLASGPSQFTAVVRDITERKSWENRIYQLAYSDSLTGLPNRLLLRDRLEHAIAAADRNRSMVGVLFFDLDHFKAINDSYGHHVGDQLLRRIAERARGCVREIDTVCRMGGDEFVLVLPELHEAADAAAVARKLLSVLSQPYSIDERELSITPTVGISIYPRDGNDADTLVRNADSAMYHAKESGKNHYRFYRPAPA